MATITITTTPEMDAAAQRETATHNNRVGPDGQMTVAAYTKMRMVSVLNEWVERYAGTDRLTKAEQYAKASVADKAAIDLILAKTPV